MFASLPMYDRPENAAAHDALWALIRDRLRESGIAAPDALDRVTDHVDGWGRDDLILGQICNLPFRARFRGRVTPIAASDYGLPDTAPGLYHSVFIVRADDPARDFADCTAHRFALNDPLSQSGWGAPSALAAARGLSLRPVLVTGAHLASLRAVVSGQADLAAIDAVTFRNFQRWEGAAAAVRVIGRTDASPGMTFITAAGQDPAPFRTAVADAIAALDTASATTLGLRGIVSLPPTAYDLPLPAPPELPKDRANVAS